MTTSPNPDPIAWLRDLEARATQGAWDSQILRDNTGLSIEDSRIFAAARNLLPKMTAAVAAWHECQRGETCAVAVMQAMSDALAAIRAEQERQS